MAATPASEIKALQERVAELERQLRELKATVANGQPAPSYWPNVPMTDEEAQAFHRSSQRVWKIIEKYRDADRKRVNAEIDRQIELEKKAAARQAKARTTAGNRGTMTGR
jgi:hypothetical protein